jgi:hypothetical protein
MVFMQWWLMCMLLAFVYKLSDISLTKPTEQEMPPLHKCPFRCVLFDCRKRKSYSMETLKF